MAGICTNQTLRKQSTKPTLQGILSLSTFIYAPLSFQVLHEQDSGGFVVDSHRALQFAIDVAKGMAYLHSLDRNMPRFHLNSKHVMVSPKEKHYIPRIHFLNTLFV